MKLYIIVNKEKVSGHYLFGGLVYEAGTESIRAFTKKKYAKEWMMKGKYEDFFEIRAVEVL